MSERAAEIIKEVDRLVTENLNGPGEKKKSGGLARGGRISQNKHRGGGQDADGGYGGAGGGVQGPEPQAKSGEPAEKEDELEKDYLEMDDEPLQPQSPLGKLVAQAFDQPIGEPKGEESDEPDEEQLFPKKPVEETHRNKSSRQGRSKARAGKRQVRIDRQAAKRKGRVEEDYQGSEQTVTDKDGNELEVDEDAFRTAQKTEPTEVQQMDEPFTVQTKEGPAEGKAGDYLARGVDGEEWPIDQKIFDKTHEFVDPEIQTEAKAGGRVFVNIAKDGTLRYAVSHGGKGHAPQYGPKTRTSLQQIKNRFPGYDIQVQDEYGEVKEDSLKNVTPTDKNKWAAVRRKDGKPVTVTVPMEAKGLAAPDFEMEVEIDEARTGSYGGRSPIEDQPFGPFKGPGSNSGAGTTGGPSEAKQPSAQKVHGMFLRDPEFRASIERAHKDIKSNNKSKVRAAFELLKHNGLLGLRYSDMKPKTWQDVWKAEATATKSHKMTPARAKVLNLYNSDPKFRGQLDQAWGVWRNANASPAEKKNAAKFLKGLGLVEAMREAIKSSGGGPRSMKRTSGSTEWGRTKKTGKTSKSNLRRSATKRARRQGKDQARMTEGTILQVRPDCWAAKNLIGEVKHFTAPKIAEMYANSKGKGNFGVWTNRVNIGNVEEAAGGRWKTNARHFQPDDDDDAKTIARGMVSVDESPDHLSSAGGTSSGSDRHGTFLGKSSLSPEEMKVIDTNWKKILKFADEAFKAKPLPVALRTIEKYLEELGIDSSHSMKIGDVLAKQLNKDRDPVSMIIPKVIPKIQQEPYTKGSGYNAGGTGGMGPR